MFWKKVQDVYHLTSSVTKEEAIKYLRNAKENPEKICPLCFRRFCRAVDAEFNTTSFDAVYRTKFDLLVNLVGITSGSKWAKIPEDPIAW